VAKDQPVAIAKTYFDQLLLARLQASAAAFRFPQVVHDDGLLGGTIVHQYSMKQQIYGKSTASFSAAWTHLSSWPDIMLATGMFSPVPNSNWTQWAASLQNTAFNPRGFALLGLLPGDDLIVDGCLAQNNQQTLRARFIPFSGQSVLRAGFSNAVPRPEVSWLGYLSNIHIEQVDDVCELRTMPTLPIEPTAPIPQNPGDQVTSPVVDVGQLGQFGPLPGPGVQPIIQTQKAVPRTGIIGATLQNNQGSSDLSYNAASLQNVSVYSQYADLLTTTVQIRNTPSFRVILYGSAVRAGWGIVPPSLVSVGGVPAILANQEGDGFSQVQLESWLGVPLIGAKWRLRYLLPGVPTGPIPIPDGPYPLGS
jgi:hypothetical protein